MYIHFIVQVLTFCLLSHPLSHFFPPSNSLYVFLTPFQVFIIISVYIYINNIQIQIAVSFNLERNSALLEDINCQ